MPVYDLTCLPGLRAPCIEVFILSSPARIGVVVAESVRFGSGEERDYRQYCNCNVKINTRYSRLRNRLPLDLNFLDLLTRGLRTSGQMRLSE